jgi:HSP20 family protein
MNALMTPSPVMTSLRNEMDRLFERVLDGDFEALPPQGWSPALDLSETEEAITIRMEVPGIDPKDIRVQLKGPILTVRGEKRREGDPRKERMYRSERIYGSFLRVLQLPYEVREDNVTAVFKHGLLTISLLKRPESAGTTIPVRTN